jgi:quercetin dioxygenase-like cupin family protein
LEEFTMTFHGKWVSLAATILYFALVANHAKPTENGGGGSSGKMERARVAFTHALPDLDGRHLKATVVEVNYGPGESSSPHRHPCAVIGYVLEGALRTQVQGEPEAVYRTGESFYEAANGVHQVSANASETDRARFIAYFVCDHDGPLSVEAQASGPAGGR